MNKRLYSLFQREGKRWKRISEAAYNRNVAVRVFQNQLLDGVLSGKELALRPLKEEATPEQKREPLEKVFPPGHEHHERLVYDTIEGKYYDRGTDLYLTDEELNQYGLDARKS